MKTFWKRIVALAMLAMMLLAVVSCGGDEQAPVHTEGQTTAPATATTVAEPEQTKPPVKERDVPYNDKIEDDTVNDIF